MGIENVEIGGMKIQSLEEARLDEAMGFITPDELEVVEKRFQEKGEKPRSSIGGKIQGLLEKLHIH